jgi:serine/threonine protein kinase/Tol biopolymer transport system component
LEPLIGSTVSHYQVLERLGGGGMGVVYKAWDSRLERFAALKLLAAGRGEVDDRRRFLREAQAASNLDHPNVCTVYEAGESADGQIFIAMAFCDGESLAVRLRRGPLPVGEALDLAAQVAAGLQAAHDKGIVHRDIKPGNIMLVAGGRAVIVDFGIAQLAEQSRLTRAGALMGTPAYVAPELLLGKTADARSDIWSLGVMLYEMVTGRLPFDGADDRAMVAAILGGNLLPLARLRSDLPPDLDRILAGALARQPADRFRHAGELGAGLRAVAATSRLPSAGEPSADRAPAGDLTGGRSSETLVERRRHPRGAAAGASPLAGEALIGCMVSHFRILEVLGGGGMGIVYKAEDTQLERTIALKFLPPELTRDPEAKARFLQEARAASALDHPNICTIHEIGETPAGQLFLAMACYDGETLKKRLAGGPLPLAQVEDFGLQICHGLAKAHHQGIVHRDVKPANLMITGDGIVKILDFGLAKLAGAAAITRAGSVLGTPAYMSPEQARGEEVDARTDLWALGAVLYEMAAGRRPFPGDHHQAVLHLLLHGEPEPLVRWRSDAPRELARVIGCLLAKDPAQRYQSAVEAAGALAAVEQRAGRSSPRHAGPGHAAQARASQEVSITPPPLPSGRGAAGTRRRRAALFAAPTALLLATAGFVLLRLSGGHRGGAPPAAGGGAPIHATFSQLTDYEGSESFPGLSPDGSFFVFTKSTHGKSDILLQRVGGGNPIDLTRDSPLSDTQPAFSPDGQQIAFRSERAGGGIFLMGATGESVRRLTDFGFNPAWSPDGSDILCATEGVSSPTTRTYPSQIWRVNVATGGKRLVSAGDAVQPSWSPHGLRIAFWGFPAGSARRVLWTIPADPGDPPGRGAAVPLVDDAYVNWSPAWAPDGQYLYFASDRSGTMNLWRIPVEEATGRALGEPEPLATPSRSSGLISISRDGRRIAYATRDGKANLERIGFDPTGGRLVGSPEAITQGSRNVRSCDVSPDGRWVAFHSLLPRENLFVVGADGSGLRELTNDPYKDREPKWSPDGSRLAFYSNRSGRYELWSIRADGGGVEQVTRTRGPMLAGPLWSPDGRQLACYLEARGAALVDLLRPLGERAPVRLPRVGNGQNSFTANSWSADGRWLAGNEDRSSGDSIPGIMLYSVPSARYSRLTDRGIFPYWLHDSRHLIYRDAGGLSWLDTRTREARPLLEPLSNTAFGAFCTSPDDRVLYVVRETDEGHIWILSMR